MATLYVSPAGSDAVGNPGTAVGSPLLTLNRANTLASPGDTIQVATGDYPEQVTVADSNTTWVGAVDTNGTPTVRVLGGGTRQRGFYVSGSQVTGVTIRNFEITGQTYAGVNFVGAKGVDNSHLVENCHIHHVSGTGANQHGCRFTYGNPIVRNCHIHHCGPANETWGIYNEYTHSALFEGNVIHNIRKEGIRGFRDKATVRRNNRIFLCWLGIADAFSLSPLTYNNFIYHCTYGINPKHSNSSSSSTLDSYTVWGFDPVTQPQPWSRWYHNTISDCTDASVAFMNAETTTAGVAYGVAREIEIRNNIFAGNSGAHIRDHNTGVDHSLVVIDTNVYSAKVTDTPDAYTYINGFSYFTASEHKTLQAMRDALGWDVHGTRMDPALIDPGPAANYDPTSSATVNALGTAGLTLGQQVGARAATIAPVKATWTPRVMTFVSGNVTNGARVFDRKAQTYALGTATNSQVVGDMGASYTIDHAFADVYSHGSTANPKGYRFEVADSTAGPWFLAEEGNNFDSFGASIKYEWPAVTGRYVRYTVPTNFGSTTQTILSGFQAGSLTYVDSRPPPDITPPTVILREPLPNSLDVSVSTAVSVTFSEEVDGVSSTTFRITPAAGSSSLPAAITQAAATKWTLTPSAPLATATAYTVSLTGGPTAIRDQFGNAVASSSWQFTTAGGTGTDPTPQKPGHGRFRGL